MADLRLVHPAGCNYHEAALRIIVTNILWRNPGVLAKIATTIDHVSGGRIELGLGAGAAGAEQAQFALPTGTLGQRIYQPDETIQFLRALWSQPRTTFDGKRFQIQDAIAEPKPFQPSVPIWVGGMGEERTLHIIAEHPTAGRRSRRRSSSTNRS